MPAMLPVAPLHPLFAAEVAGMRLEDIALDEFHAAMDRYAVLAIRNERPPSNEEHLAFSRRLGPLQQMKMLTMRMCAPARRCISLRTPRTSWACRSRKGARSSPSSPRHPRDMRRTTVLER